MRFQSVKCNMMTLSRKKKTIEYKYTLKGTELEFLTSIKYLGVNITNDLRWGKHIEEICNKSYGTLGLLKKEAQYHHAPWKLSYRHIKDSFDLS